MTTLYNTSLRSLARTTTALVLAAAISGCANTRPQMTSIQDSLDNAMAQPVADVAIALPEPETRAPGSLWRSGAKQFFRDSRASNIGDVITVIVSESATAETEANTTTTRNHDNSGGITTFLNAAGKLASRGIATGAGGLFDVEGDRSFTGAGSTDRTDTLTARVAAVVTQVLPNGNMVIQGKREVVVNYELQELSIQGIVRPEDVTADNTIASEKIAEARISYAGRGLVDEAQEPAPGVRFINKWMPF